MAGEAGLCGEDVVRLRSAAAVVAAALACTLPEAVDWIERKAASAQRAGPQAAQHYAARLLKLRPMRDALLAAPLFQDLAWTMLLDLFVSEGEGRRVSVSSLTIASGGAPTTALRYIDKLIAHGLVVRSDDNADGRRSWISLTPATRAAITALVERMQEG